MTKALAIIIVILLNTAHYASEKLVVSAAPDATPYAWDENNKLVGMSVELIKLIFDDLQIPVTTKILPWARSIKNLKEGEIDAILTFFHSEERATYATFTVPYTTVGTSVFVHKGKTFPFYSWHDLISYRGVAIRGDSLGENFDQFAKEKLNLSKVGTVDQLIKMLVAGRTDYVVYAKNSLLFKARKLGLDNKISALAIPLSFEYLSFGFSNKSPFIKYIPKINNKIEQFKKDGTIERLLEKYITIASET